MFPLHVRIISVQRLLGQSLCCGLVGCGHQSVRILSLHPQCCLISLKRFFTATLKNRNFAHGVEIAQSALWLDYWLNNRRDVVRLPDGVRDYSLFLEVQPSARPNQSAIQPIRCNFAAGNHADVGSSSRTSIQYQYYKWVELNSRSPIRLSSLWKGKCNFTYILLTEYTWVISFIP